MSELHLRTPGSLGFDRCLRREDPLSGFSPAATHQPPMQVSDMPAPGFGRYMHHVAHVSDTLLTQRDQAGQRLFYSHFDSCFGMILPIMASLGSTYLQDRTSFCTSSSDRKRSTMPFEGHPQKK